MPLEKDKLKQALAAEFEAFIHVFSSFDENLINKKPSPESWSPAQVAVHMIMAADGVPDNTTEPLNREVDALLPAIRPWWEDLDQKFDSPQPLKPDDKPHSKTELLTELERIREKDLSLLQSDLTRICMDFELPTIGYLTRYEWLWFIQMHLRRHTHQLTNMQKLLL